MALIRVSKAGAVTPTNLDLATALTDGNGTYTFTNDCEVLVINSQNGVSNVEIDGEAISTTQIDATPFKYQAGTLKYIGHISAGSVLTCSTGQFAAQLYLVTSN